MSKKNTTVERVRRKIDPNIIGEGIAMFSADDKIINLNDILYTVSYSNNYRDKENTFRIEAHRVIQINYEYRYVRVKCPKGCETTMKFAEGCSREQYFHNIVSARAKALDENEKVIQAMTDSINSRVKKRGSLDLLGRKIKKFIPAIMPKAVSEMKEIL